MVRRQRDSSDWKKFGFLFYFCFQCLCNGCVDEKSNITRVDSYKFESIICQVETLHKSGIRINIFFLNFGTESFYFIHLYYSMFVTYNKNVNLKGFDFHFFLGCLSVQKPREQVADAEALLEIIQTLLTCVRAITVKE